MSKTLFISWLTTLLLAPNTWAQTCPSWPTTQRFTFNSTGDEVTDQRTGLTWKRCSQGQSWSGSTCAGSATTHTQEAALASAQAATGWRLPNVKELAGLADRGCQSPAIDSTAFPATPMSLYWSSSTSVGASYAAWGVYFHFGNVYGGDGVRYDDGAVRLVRASQ